MYKYRKLRKSKMTGVEKLEGEPIEHKIERIVSNGEAITDGAPEIYTERAEGVLSAYNIRTDRWEIATEAMDKVSASIQAKRDDKAKVKDAKVIDMKGEEVSGAESTEAKAK
jgi:hypothetical protein